MQAMRNFETTITQVETGFNVAGSIPHVSIVSGVLRAVLGKIQAVAGAVFGLIGAVGTLVSRDAHTKARFEKMMDKGVEHMLHGVTNFVRGIGEAILGMTTFGSLLPLFIQLTSQKGFAPRLEYSDAVRIRPRAYAAL